MRKELFLGYLYGDCDLELLRQSGSNGLIVWMGEQISKRWSELQKLEINLALAFAAFGGDCPLEPGAKEELHRKVKKALSFNPVEIWLDHFRFDGHWEAIEGKEIPGIHQECQWCRGKNRTKVLFEMIGEVRKLIPKGIGLGYYAVPFKAEEIPEVISGLGQDHRLLSQSLDVISPMLYHRMIKRPVEYISEYVDYLYQLTQKPILPIIQVKDMPDDLPDKLGQDEMKDAFIEAKRLPSVGVTWFTWDHAIEKGKTRIIKESFRAESEAAL